MCISQDNMKQYCPDYRNESCITTVQTNTIFKTFKSSDSLAHKRKWGQCSFSFVAFLSRSQEIIQVVFLRKQMFRLLGGSQKSGVGDVVLGSPILMSLEKYVGWHYRLILISRPLHFVKFEPLENYTMHPKVLFYALMAICFICAIWTPGMYKGSGDIKKMSSPVYYAIAWELTRV